MDVKKSFINITATWEERPRMVWHVPGRNFGPRLVFRIFEAIQEQTPVFQESTSWYEDPDRAEVAGIPISRDPETPCQQGIYVDYD